MRITLYFILYLAFSPTVFPQINQAPAPKTIDIGVIRNADLSSDGDLLLVLADAPYVFDVTNPTNKHKTKLTNERKISYAKFFPNSHNIILGYFNSNTLAENYDGDTGRRTTTIPFPCGYEYSFGAAHVSFLNTAPKVHIHLNSNVCRDVIWDPSTFQTERGQGLLTFPHDIQFSSDDQFMALKEFDTITIYREFGAEIVTKVTSEIQHPVMSLSKAQNHMAFNKDSNTLNIYDLDTKTVLHERQFDSDISSLLYLNNGENLAVGLSNNSVEIFDLQPKSVFRSYLLGSPNTKLVDTRDGLMSIYFTSSIIELWDVEHRKIIKTISGGELTSFAMVPNQNHALIETDEGINIWDLDDWSIIQEAPSNLKNIESIYTDSDFMWGLTKINNNSFSVFDISTGQRLTTISNFDTIELPYKISGNGRRFSAVLTDEKNIQFLSVWDVLSGEIISSLRLDNIYPIHYALSYHGDQYLFSYPSLLVDVATLEITQTLDNPRAFIEGDVNFSVNDEFIVTTNRGRNTKTEFDSSIFFIWDLNYGEIIQQIKSSPHLFNPSFSSNSKYLIFNREIRSNRFYSEPTEVVVWDLETNEEVLSFVEAGVPEFSHNNKWVITRENGIKLWDVSEYVGIRDFLIHD